jgi:hypothetical protein
MKAQLAFVLALTVSGCELPVNLEGELPPDQDQWGISCPAVWMPPFTVQVTHRPDEVYEVHLQGDDLGEYEILRPDRLGLPEGSEDRMITESFSGGMFGTWNVLIVRVIDDQLEVVHRFNHVTISRTEPCGYPTQVSLQYPL